MRIIQYTVQRNGLEIKAVTTKPAVTYALKRVTPRHDLLSHNVRMLRKVPRKDRRGNLLFYDHEVGFVSALDWLCGDHEPAEWRAVDDPYAEVPF